MRTLLLALLFSASTAVAKPARVAVVTSDDFSVYTDPVKPFLQAMEKEGIRVRVIHLRGRAAEAEAASTLLRREDPKVVFALGAKAAFTVKGSVPSTPLIHASIADPGRYGIVGDQVTGVRLEAAPSMYLSQLVGLFPDIERVGVLHGEGAASGRIQAIKSAGGDVGITVAATSASNPRALRKAVPGVLDEVDALWLVPDREVLTPEVFRTVVDEARRRSVPLLVDTDNMVRAGGLFAVVADPTAVGEQAASMAFEILEGKAASLIEVQDPSATLVVLNLESLDKSGLAIDPLLLDFVDIKVD
ncbi:MAG: hypothetical protein EP330_18410 [Deltaproteobacteria bacterium]|nr:MAG: hypothetical protein EP330_18410 [Deltaproteobacteria bacterium]